MMQPNEFPRKGNDSEAQIGATHMKLLRKGNDSGSQEWCNTYNFLKKRNDSGAQNDATKRIP